MPQQIYQGNCKSHQNMQISANHMQISANPVGTCRLQNSTATQLTMALCIVSTSLRMLSAGATAAASANASTGKVGTRAYALPSPPRSSTTQRCRGAPHPQLTVRHRRSQQRQQSPLAPLPSARTEPGVAGIAVAFAGTRPAPSCGPSAASTPCATLRHSTR